MSSSRRAMAMVRHRKAPAKHPLAFAAKLVASVVSVAILSTAGIAGLAVADVTGNVNSQPGVHLVQQKNGAAAVDKTVSTSALQGQFNVLLVGSDTRADQGAQFSDAADQAASSGYGNNDVTILLHVNASHTAATVVSFPRDMITSIPSCPNPKGGWYSAMSSQMINTALSYGGLSCPVLTVENQLGINNIDYAAEITFAGVAAMSNAVGGVPVCLATPLNDPYVGLKLPAGISTLQGEQALEFLRSRHGVDDGSDLSRISSQQNFLSSLLRTVTSAGTLANPVKLFSLADAATKNMTLSDTMRSTQTMVSMALALKNIPLSQITFVQYPVVTDPTNPNRVIPDSVEGPALAQAIQNDQPVSLSASTGRGTVLAGGSTASPTSAPSATAAPTAGGSAAPSAGAGGSGGAGASTSASAPSSTPSPTSVALGQNATGQTAAEQTCTRGVNAGRF